MSSFTELSPPFHEHGRSIVPVKQSLVSQAILWGAAILAVAILDDASKSVPLLAVLATIALGLASRKAPTA